MRSMKLFCILLISAFGIYAQNFDTWKVYADLKYAISVHQIQDGFACVASGGIFVYNRNQDEYSLISKADGLSSQDFTAGSIDLNGKLWCGSSEGYINIYSVADGTIKKIIDIYKTEKSRKRINHIFVKGDSILVSTDFGLSIINAKTLSFLDTFLKLGSFVSESKVISAFKSSLIYAITEKGIAVQKQGSQNLSAPESWNTYLFNTNIPAKSASKIFSFNGKIYAASSSGILIFQNNRWEKLILDNISIVDVFQVNSILYIASATKVYSFNGSQVADVYENLNISINSLSVIENKLYLASTTGVFQLLDGAVKTYAPSSPAGNSFMNLSVGPQGNLYSATGKDEKGIGVMQYDGTDWKVFNKQNTPILPGNDYYNVFAAPDSSVIATNWGQGFTIIKNGNAVNYNADNSGMVGIPGAPKFIVITDAKTDSKGNLWVTNLMSGSRKPLSMKTPAGNFYHFGFSAYPSINENDLLDKLLIDSDDTKWFTVTVGDAGVYYFNEKKTFENSSDDLQGYISRADGLASDVPTCLALDKRGYLWIGTSAGINIIFNTKSPSLKTAGSSVIPMRNQSVTSIAVDPVDQKWIGTKQGVYLLSSDGTQVLRSYNSLNSPLPSDDIKSIAIDSKNGIVYIGTDYGLAQFRTTFLDPQDSYTEINIYPNPYIVNQHTTQITIDGLMRNSQIKIIDISGKVIREFTTPGGRVAQWDAKDENGDYVATGIYIIVMYDEDANNVATAKVAVIKK